MRRKTLPFYGIEPLSLPLGMYFLYDKERYVLIKIKRCLYMEKQYRVLLYYQYVPIEDPETFTAEHLAFCKELGLLGRILISSEGINGTVSGTIEQTDKYMQALKEIRALHLCRSKSTKQMVIHLKKCMSVSEEIVNLSLKMILIQIELTGKHLSPVEFYKQMQS